uniref:DUF4216 domain-containing protein n=1 Tax=Ananas comosus var. bracteatus TaxID=296719 RepID=A0A6V7PFF6_ANACO|nr:unnamed protein product [Ananas comosus var. bracteatus]
MSESTSEGQHGQNMPSDVGFTSVQASITGQDGIRELLQDALGVTMATHRIFSENCAVLRTAPAPPSGTDVLRQLEGINYKYGKGSKLSRKRAKEDISTTTDQEFIEEMEHLSQKKVLDDADGLYEAEDDDNASDASTHAAQRRANRSIRANQSVEHKWLVEKFPGWLFGQVPKMAESKCSDDIIAIARGPNNVVKKFSGFIINGFRFHTKDREKLRKTQNSGVMVEAEGQAYYGVLTDIIELDYYGSFKVVLFRCDWADITSQKGLKKDTNGCTLVNFSKLIHTGQLLKDDPFVFSSQAKQVFYIQDPRYEEWSQVVMTKPRDLYDMGAHLQDDAETYTQCMSCDVIVTDELNDCISWARKDIDENNVIVELAKSGEIQATVPLHPLLKLLLYLERKRG